MNAQIKLTEELIITQNFNSFKYKIENNKIKTRLNKKFDLTLKNIKIDQKLVVIDEISKFEVFDVQNNKINITKNIPFELNGIFTMKFRDLDCLDLNRSLFTAVSTEVELSSELLLANKKIFENSHFRINQLKKLSADSQNCFYLGHDLDTSQHNNRVIPITIEDLIIIEELLKTNPLRMSKYILIDFSGDNIKFWSGINKQYLLNIFTNISKKIDIFIRLTDTQVEKSIFKQYEKVVKGCIYPNEELISYMRSEKTRGLKINNNRLLTGELEYTLNSCSRRNVALNLQAVNSFNATDEAHVLQLIMLHLKQSILENKILNINTNFNPSFELLKIIESLKCSNITFNSWEVNSECKGQQIDIALINAYPRLNNGDYSRVNSFVTQSTCAKVFLIGDPNNNKTEILDGNLIFRLPFSIIKQIISYLPSIAVLGYNNDILEIIRESESNFIYHVDDIRLDNYSPQLLTVFKKQMWKIIGLNNVSFKFANKLDIAEFDQLVNIHKLPLQYEFADTHYTEHNNHLFASNGQHFANINRLKADEIEILKAGAYIVKYNNNEQFNTLIISDNDESYKVTNKALLHLPVGARICTNGLSISIYITDAEYNMNEFKKYKNEMFINSTTSGEYIEDYDFSYQAEYQNYNGIYIYDNSQSDMYASNLTLDNYDQVVNLFNQLTSQKLFIFRLDDDNQITNIITTYTVLVNLEVSLFSTQNDLLEIIKDNNLWSYVEVIK